jgi:uncharacterized protein (TIGR04255 family)
VSIKYCKNSTINEAWALVAGLPGPVDETEANVIIRSARESFPDLEQKPLPFGVHLGADPAAPFWNHQFTWRGGRHMARIGHRYLTVHFIRQSDRYEAFDETLRPSIETWLDLYRGALGKAATQHVVGVVGFGYVNRFEFAAATDFDVSRYFRLNIGISLGEPRGGLTGLDSGFRFYDEKSNEQLSVNLSAQEAGKQIVVSTKVFAERRAGELGAFSDRDLLMRTIVEAKDSAKETFFGFATQETYDIMQVVADDAD